MNENLKYVACFLARKYMPVEIACTDDAAERLFAIVEQHAKPDSAIDVVPFTDQINVYLNDRKIAVYFVE